MAGLRFSTFILFNLTLISVAYLEKWYLQRYLQEIVKLAVATMEICKFIKVAISW